MISYKIIESSVDFLRGIDLPFDFSNYKVGQYINILGKDMQITQIGDEIIACSNTENIFVFQKI